MNARYYAGKQIICDFVGVTRWKVAICGEYMKSRLKTCSHGSACNFIHCFRNPGGDYEWADWDNPPPRYWIKRMIFLFGTSAESGYDKELESVDHKKHNEPKRVWKPKNDRHRSERFHSKEINLSSSSSDGELNSKLRYTKHSIKAEHSVKRRRHLVSEDKNEQPSERHRSEDHFYSKTYCSHSDEDVESTSKEINHRRYAVNIPPERDGRHERRSSSRRKRKLYSEEQENSESKPRKKLDRTNSKDRGLAGGDFNEKYSSEDHDEDEDYDVAKYHYGSRSDNRRKYDEHSLRRRRSRQLHEHRLVEESDESPGRWKASDNDFLFEET